MEFPNFFKQEPLVSLNQGISRFKVTSKRSCAQLYFFFSGQKRLPEDRCNVAGSKA